MLSSKFFSGAPPRITVVKILSRHVLSATTSDRRVGRTNPHCYWHRDSDICGNEYKRGGSKRKEDVLLDPGGHCSSPSSSIPPSSPDRVPGAWTPTLSGRVNASSDSDTRRLRRVLVFAHLPFFPPLRPECACLPLAIYCRDAFTIRDLRRRRRRNYI